MNGETDEKTKPKIDIRPARSGDDQAVWEVAKTLSLAERYYYYYLTYKRHSAEALVAVEEERVVGCVIPIVKTIAGEKAGLVGGIFVDRRTQGKGVGRALAEAALQHFQAEDCEAYYVLVDRYNSSSWNMFLHKGFSPFDLKQQLRVFGFKILSLWWANGYFLEPGTFILRKRSREEHTMGELGERQHYLLAWLGSFVVLTISISLNGALFPLSSAFLSFALLFLGVVGISIFAHELAHKLAASFLGLKTIFKIWESGLVFSALLALLGITLFYPSYGSTFVAQKDWPYHKNIQKMGLIYASGPAVSLLVAFCFLGLAFWGEQTGAELLQTVGHTGFILNYIIVLFNLIPVFPFTVFDGRKILVWSKLAWGLLVAGCLLLTTLFYR